MMQRITLLLLSLSSSFPLNAVATVHQVGARSDHLDLRPRGQIVFPPANGPCLQNAGKVPCNFLPISQQANNSITDVQF